MVLCLNVVHPVLQGARACVQLWAPRGEALHLPLPSPFLMALLSHNWRFSVWLSARGKQPFILLYLFWGEKGIDRRLAGSSCGNSRALWSSPPLLWAGAQTALGPQNCRAHVHLCSGGGQCFGELTQGLHSRPWRGGVFEEGTSMCGVAGGFLRGAGAEPSPRCAMSEGEVDLERKPEHIFCKKDGENEGELRWPER